MSDSVKRFFVGYVTGTVTAVILVLAIIMQF